MSLCSYTAKDKTSTGELQEKRDTDDRRALPLQLRRQSHVQEISNGQRKNIILELNASPQNRSAQEVWYYQ
jgi:hypothetical protein